MAGQGGLAHARAAGPHPGPLLVHGQTTPHAHAHARTRARALLVAPSPLCAGPRPRARLGLGAPGLADGGATLDKRGERSEGREGRAGRESTSASGRLLGGSARRGGGCLADPQPGLACSWLRSSERRGRGFALARENASSTRVYVCVRVCTCVHVCARVCGIRNMRHVHQAPRLFLGVHQSTPLRERVFSSKAEVYQSTPLRSPKACPTLVPT